MFSLQPISTTNLFSIAQIFVVALGFYFSWHSLRAALKNIQLSTAATQVQLYNQLVLQGRELQFKFMEVHFPGEEGSDLKSKKDMLLGMIIAYYASAFELRNLFGLPQSAEKLLRAELKELMRQAEFNKKWDQVRHLHSKEFVDHVQSLVGVQ